MQMRPAAFIMSSASLAVSRLHWPTLLQMMIRNLSACAAVCMIPNLRLIILSLASDMSLSSQVMGFRT